MVTESPSHSPQSPPSTYTLLPPQESIPPPTPVATPLLKRKLPPCINCQKVRKRCDNIRPCPRCVKHDLIDSCLVRRKRGRPSAQIEHTVYNTDRMEILSELCSSVLESIDWSLVLDSPTVDSSS